MNWINKNTFKYLIIAKLVVIGGVIASMDGSLTIGDKILSAAEEVAKKVEEKTSDQKDGEKIADASAATDAPKEKRRSFIDDLLNLPKLDSSNVKKEEIGRYLALAERKQQQIEERLDILKKREAQLVTLEKNLDTKLEKIEEERQFLRQTVQEEKNLKDERVTTLVAVYKKMDPKKAAPLFEKMDKDLAVEMFKQFPEKQVMGILSKMTPDKSVEITEYYGRVKSMREYDLLKEMNNSLKKEFQDCKGLPKTAEAPAPQTADVKK